MTTFLNWLACILAGGLVLALAIGSCCYLFGAIKDTTKDEWAEYFSAALFFAIIVLFIWAVVRAVNLVLA